MAQSGYTPILIYGSGTATNVPLAANMTTSASGVELALNYADGKLFYKDSGGTVQVLATKGAGTIGGSNTQVQYNSSGALAGSANLTFNGTTLTANALTTTSTVTINGGTANGVAYLNGSKVLTTGSALTFDGSALTVSSGNIRLSNAYYLSARNNANTAYINLIGRNTSDQVVIDADGYGTLIGAGGALTLNSAGNLGLGVTPSAWTAFTGLQLTGGGAALVSAAGELHLGSNWYFNSGNKYYANGFATRYDQQSGEHRWFNAASGTAGNAVTFTQAMTLDAGGNLGVGTTSPSQRLQVKSAALGSNPISVINQANSNTIASFVNWSTGDGGLQINDGGGNARLIFDSSGNLLVANTTSSGTPSQGFQFVAGSASTAYIGHASGSSSGTQYVSFYYNSSNIGSITQAGTTGVLYNITSDYRLKTVIGSVAGAGERIDALEPIEYEWKADGSRTRGFLAHKFQEVYPQSVSGEKDAVNEDGSPKYQNMQASTSEVIADLVAEIQSLRQRVASLEA